MRRTGRTKPTHRSKLEDKVIQSLIDRGIPYEYEAQTFDYTSPVRRGYCTVCDGRDVRVRRRYTPDLKVNGSWIEIKGKLDAKTRSRMEDFLESNPGFDLRFIFQRDNWLTTKHKSRYSDWCKERGIKYHIGEEVPEEWINGGSHETS